MTCDHAAGTERQAMLVSHSTLPQNSIIKNLDLFPGIMPLASARFKHFIIMIFGKLRHVDIVPNFFSEALFIRVIQRTFKPLCPSSAPWIGAFSVRFRHIN